MSSDEHKPLANVRLHPAIIVIGALILHQGGRYRWAFGSNWGPAKLFDGVGKGMAAVGVVALVLAYGAMARYGTTIDPRRQTTRIITTGIYQFSRNPIYLGWFFALLGVGVMNMSVYQMLVSVAMVALLHWAVVLPEEKYLEEKFGDEYLQYKDRVNRWL